MNGSSVVLRLSNHLCLWFFCLEAPSWQALAFFPFFVHGCFGFWYLHRLCDGDGSVYEVPETQLVFIQTPNEVGRQLVKTVRCVYGPTVPWTRWKVSLTETGMRRFRSQVCVSGGCCFLEGAGLHSHSRTEFEIMAMRSCEKRSCSTT